MTNSCILIILLLIGIHYHKAYTPLQIYKMLLIPSQPHKWEIQIYLLLLIQRFQEKHTSIVMSANTQITCGSSYAISLFGFFYSRNLLYNPPNVAFVSDQSVQFNSVKSVNVYCDMITGSYQNNNQSNLLGVITVNANPFNIQTFDAVQLMSVPIVLQDIIFNFSIYLTDDKGNQLDFTNGNTLNTQYWNIKLMNL